MKKRYAKALLLSLPLLFSGCGRTDGAVVSEQYGVHLTDVKIESESVNPEPESARPESESVSPEPERVRPEPESVSPEPESVRPESENVSPEPESVRPESENVSPGLAGVKSEPGELLDAFLAGEIPAYYSSGTDTFMVSDLPVDEEDYFSYSVGERVDLDNDGEKEQIVNGPYGGIYFDARDGKVYVLAEGEGTAGVLFYADFDNAVWVVHCDTTHAGRQMYWLTKYDGSGNAVDEFLLSAEYWGSPEDKYDENSDFTYRDKKITMTEFEELRDEIVGSTITRAF